MSNEIPYIRNYPLKPLRIDINGYVVFTTNGTDEVPANEEQCKAYGYKYDNATRTCRAFSVTSGLSGVIRNETNIIKGVKNTIGIGTDNTMIRGNDNMTNGLSRNLIINGDGHYVASQVDNVIITGNKSETTITNTITIGGNNNTTDVRGKRQLVKFIMGNRTSDATTTNLLINNTAGSNFVPSADSMGIFNADILGVRTGGTGAGTDGDYISYKMNGMYRNSFGLEPITRDTTTEIDSEGEVGSWAISTDYDLTDGFEMKVTGVAGVDIEWIASVEFTTMKI